MTKWADKIVLVMGGDSAERDISLKTGRAMAKALRDAGVEPVVVDLVPGNVGELIEAHPDVVVIALHGGLGEGGPLQGLLEYLQIPYTGSGVLASALAMDKVRSKRVFESAGVPTPAWGVVGDEDELPEGLGFPVVVKPSLEGSSVGVVRVDDTNAWSAALATCRGGAGEPLVEACIEGRELSVVIADGEVLGIVEIAAADGFYDFDAKYTRGDTEYRVPAPLDDVVNAHVDAIAASAYDALGCRGVARVDVMLDADGRGWVLEANTIPGMTATSLVPKVAAWRGTSFPDLMLQMLENATTDLRVQTGEGA